MRALSIRARLIVGMVLLVSVGLAVANGTGILLLRAYLAGPGRRAGRGHHPARRPTGSGAAPVRRRPAPEELCENPRDPRGLRSDFVLARAGRRRRRRLLARARTSATPRPDLDAVPTVADDRLVTVPSLDGEDRWRLRARPTTRASRPCCSRSRWPTPMPPSPD